jgi:hypothetical protein
MTGKLIAACLALITSLTVRGQSSGEFLFTLMDGTSFTRQLSQDWRPEFRDHMLYITPRDRIFTMDLAAVQPALPDDIRGLHEVKVIIRTVSGGSVRRYFLLKEEWEQISDAPLVGDFYMLGPQTLVRKGAYSVEID